MNTNTTVCYREIIRMRLKILTICLFATAASKQKSTCNQFKDANLHSPTQLDTLPTLYHPSSRLHKRLDTTFTETNAYKLLDPFIDHVKPVIQHTVLGDTQVNTKLHTFI